MRSSSTAPATRWLAPSLLLLLACSGPPPPGPGPAAPRPLGASAFRQELEHQAGMRLPLEAVREALARERAFVSARLEEEALAMGATGGWSQAAAELQLLHPESIEALLEAYRTEIREAESFVAQRALVPLPGRPLEVVELTSPMLRQAFPLAVYIGGRLAVTTGSGRGPDRSYLENQCWSCIPPLAVHEGVPGHHAGMQWLEGDLGRANRFFLEGWAQYAEILMLEEGYYETAARRFGAWRLVLLRILRCDLDLALHVDLLSVEEAEARYRSEALLSAGAAATEVRQHLGRPGSKSSYLLGMLQILELRRRLPGVPRLELHRRLLETTRAAPLPVRAREGFGVELEALGSLADDFGSTAAEGR